MYKTPLKTVFFLCSFYIYSVCGLEQQLMEQKIESYQSCKLDSDCRENSFCFGNDDYQRGNCKCFEDYLMLSRNKTYYACLKAATFGENCAQDNQCYQYMGTLAKCSTTCQCPEGTHLYHLDGKCYETILLNDLCKLDANCLLEDGFGFCIRAKCSCNIGQTPSKNRKSCIDAKAIGEMCTSDDQCGAIENSNCREVCRCAVGYILSTDKTQCLKAATYFGDPCTNDQHAQCAENLIGSVCIDGKCSCGVGLHGFGSKCVKSSALGETCTSMEECIPEKRFEDVVNCIKGKCECLPGVHDERFGCNSSSIRLPTILLLIFLFFLFCLF